MEQKIHFTTTYLWLIPLTASKKLSILLPKLLEWVCNRSGPHLLKLNVRFIVSQPALIHSIRFTQIEPLVRVIHPVDWIGPHTYWLSDARIFVSAANPVLIKDFVDDSLRSPKTDKVDSKKSHVILLTAGQNWTNMEPWIKHATNSKPWTDSSDSTWIRKLPWKTTSLPFWIRFIREPMTSLTALHAPMAARNFYWPLKKWCKRKAESKEVWSNFNLHIRPASYGGLVFVLSKHLIEFLLSLYLIVICLIRIRYYYSHDRRKIKVFLKDTKIIM